MLLRKPTAGVRPGFAVFLFSSVRLHNYEAALQPSVAGGILDLRMRGAQRDLLICIIYSFFRINQHRACWIQGSYGWE